MKSGEKSPRRANASALLLALLVVALPSCRPSGDEREASMERDSLPRQADLAALDEWQATLEDGGADVGGGLQVVVENDGLHVSGGPGGLLWRDADLAAGGDFRWTAEIESAAGGDYGVLVGGKNLTFPDREYTSFLMRPTGEYRIERREAGEVTVLVDWTPVVAGAPTPGGQPAGRAASEGTGVGRTATQPASGEPTGGVSPTPRATTTPAAPPVIGPAEGSAPRAGSTNEGRLIRSATGDRMTLAVTVEGEEVYFRVGGSVVKVLPTSEAEPYGLAGLRLGAGSTAVVKRTALDPS